MDEARKHFMIDPFTKNHVWIEPIIDNLMQKTDAGYCELFANARSQALEAIRKKKSDIKSRSFFDALRHVGLKHQTTGLSPDIPTSDGPELTKIASQVAVRLDPKNTSQVTPSLILWVKILLLRWQVLLVKHPNLSPAEREDKWKEAEYSQGDLNSLLNQLKDYAPPSDDLAPEAPEIQPHDESPVQQLMDVQNDNEELAQVKRIFLCFINIF